MIGNSRVDSAGTVALGLGVSIMGTVGALVALPGTTRGAGLAFAIGVAFFTIGVVGRVTS